MEDSKQIRNILGNLSSIDESLRTVELWSRNKTQRDNIILQRRTDVAKIRKYINQHLLVVLELERKLREATMVKKDARVSYEKQLDNLTF